MLVPIRKTGKISSRLRYLLIAHLLIHHVIITIFLVIWKRTKIDSRHYLLHSKRCSSHCFSKDVLISSEAPFIVHSTRLKKFHEAPIKLNDDTDPSDSNENGSDCTLKQKGVQGHLLPEIEKTGASETKVNRQEDKSYFTDGKIPNYLTTPKPSCKKNKQSKTLLSDETTVLTDRSIADTSDNHIFQVEAIRNHKTRKGKIVFLIKWKD